VTRRKRVTRKKKSAAAQVRPFWLLITLLAVAAASAGYWAATWPGFFPKRIAITGNRIVPSSEIAARAQIQPHANVWLQNMHAAAQRIESIPYVKDAYVHRSVPAGVRIEIAERTPYAVVSTATESVLIDRDLRVLKRVDEPLALPQFIVKAGDPPANGAFITDPAVERLASDCDALSLAHVVVRSLSYDKFGDLVATMHSGVRLLLGDDADLQKKAALVGPIISQVAAGGRRIAAVDLRAPTTPVVVYR
jgi:cell division protein FtsQ